MLGSTGHGLTHGWCQSSTPAHDFQHAKDTCEPRSRRRNAGDSGALQWWAAAAAYAACGAA